MFFDTKIKFLTTEKLEEILSKTLTEAKYEDLEKYIKWAACYIQLDSSWTGLVFDFIQNVSKKFEKEIALTVGQKGEKICEVLHKA